MMDVDYFKVYNDTYGHPAGDDILRQVATILHDTFRPQDITARYGGEEFVVILLDTGVEGAQLAAERCREAIEAAPWLHCAITASFGAATFTKGIDAEDLLRSADQALYRAKATGRNRVVHADTLSQRLKK
jgi:diguanylate cyclase (GGDEF)-like protein